MDQLLLYSCYYIHRNDQLCDETLLIKWTALLAVNLVDYRFQSSANRDLFFLLLARPFHFSAFQCFLWCSKATLSCRFPPLSSNSVIVTVQADYWLVPLGVTNFLIQGGENDPSRIHDGNGWWKSKKYDLYIYVYINKFPINGPSPSEAFFLSRSPAGAGRSMGELLNSTMAVIYITIPHFHPMHTEATSVFSLLLAGTIPSLTSRSSMEQSVWASLLKAWPLLLFICLQANPRAGVDIMYIPIILWFFIPELVSNVFALPKNRKGLCQLPHSTGNRIQAGIFWPSFSNGLKNHADGGGRWGKSPLWPMFLEPSALRFGASNSYPIYGTAGQIKYRRVARKHDVYMGFKYVLFSWCLQYWIIEWHHPALIPWQGVCKGWELKEKRGRGK